MNTSVISFLATLLVSGVIISTALPIDADGTGNDGVLDHVLFNRNNIMERRSRNDVKLCISGCVSCAKYAELPFNFCMKGCDFKAGRPAEKNEFEAWHACEQFLYR